MKILTVFLLCFLPQQLFPANNPDTIIVVTDTLQSISIGKQIYYYEDKTGELTLSDVNQADFAKNFTLSHEENPNFGFTKSAYWVRFTLKNTGQQQKEYRLECGYPLINYIDFHLPNGEVRKAGTKLPFSHRDVQYRNNVFCLLAQPDTLYTYYMRFETQSSMQFPLSLQTPLYFSEKLNKEQLAWGLYFGIVLIMAIYNLFLLFSMKNLNYLYYPMYVLAYGIFQFSLKGLSYEYFWSDSIWWANHSVPMFMELTTASAVQFCQHFLKTKNGMPKLHKILEVFKWFNIAVAVSAFIIPYNVSIRIGTISVMVSTILIIVAAAVRLLQNYKPAKFFFIAWITLLTGVIVYSLKTYGVLPTSFWTDNGMPIGNTLEIVLLSFALSHSYKILKQDKEKTQTELLLLQKQTNEELEQTVKERTAEIRTQNVELEQQSEEIKAQNEDLNTQKEEIEAQRDRANEQRAEIIDSINYAKRIQEAVFPSAELAKEILHEHFILFKPQHIVSGDFYWVKKIKNFTIVAAADCTGHGVPGAFMSMLGSSFLNEIVTLRSIESAGKILNNLREKVKKSLHQDGREGEQKDGMDIAFYIIDTETLELQFSGAYNSLYIIRKKELISLKANRQPISIHLKETDFNTESFQLQKGDCIYSFSDGYADQFGGEKGGKFKTKNFKNLLLSISEKPMEEQHQILDKHFEDWRGEIKQIDDVLVLGVKI